MESLCYKTDASVKFKVDGPGRFHSVMARLKSIYRVAPDTLNETLPTGQDF